MNVVLTSSERDKAVYALHDVSVALFGDPRKLTYDDLDEVQTILASRGLQLAPIPKVAPFVPTAPVAQGQAPAAASKISTNDQYWLETVIQKYQHAKQSNVAGFNFKNEAVGRLLAIACPVLGIPFTK